MYHTEKLTPEMVRQIQAGEDRRHYKTAGSRIVFSRHCDHCDGEYWPARKNQKYCSGSCRVGACRQRRGYPNISTGKKMPNNTDVQLPKKGSQEAELQGTIQSPENTGNPQSPQWDWNRVGESAAGSAAINGAKYWLHDRLVMQKLDQLLQLVQNSPLVKIPVSSKPLYFLGLQTMGNATVALFQHPKEGHIYAHDHSGRWYQLVSNNPVRWKKL